MKHIVFSVLALMAANACQGAVVTSDEAMAAARSWLHGKAMIAKGISTEPESVRTVENGDGSSYHVVSLVGGGFVVLSADDGIEPVIAFSATGKFPEESDGEPVRALLARDIGDRAAGLNVGGGAFRRLAFASCANVMATPEAKWAKMLAVTPPNTKLRAYASGIESVSDIRVEPLVKSQWGQQNDSGYSNVGDPCFNLYTPEQCPCGCVPTAMAQIMRYWEYPASVKAFSRNCEVNAEPVVLSVMAGKYEWNNMPLDPSKGTTVAQREAIGKLTYDCSVAMCSAYYPAYYYYAGALGAFAFSPLVEVFGYKNAMTYCPDNVSAEDVEQAVYASLDAGSPVMLGFSDGASDLHEVVADGYGYVADTAYVHLNVGWTAISGSDLWYNLPNVTFTMAGSYPTTYSVIDHVIYNVFPNTTGDVLSGRVTDANGNPLANVEVKVFKGGGKSVLGTTTTSEYGIYAFVLPGGQKYDVTAGGVTQKGIVLTKSGNPSWVDLETGKYNPSGMVRGNSWGNDFVLGDTPGPEPEPETDPSVEVSCDLDGAELTLGQAVTFPVEVKCTACSVKSVKASGLPSGLKFVSGKKAAPYDYVITGTPKKASLKPSTVKLTVQAKADEGGTLKEVVEYEVWVLPLDDWAVGTFSGMAEIDGTAAAFTMTVKNTGAISGKVTVGKKGYSFKANGFTDVTESRYRVDVDGILGDKLAIDIVPRAFGGDEVGAITNGCISAAQEIWKLKEYKKFLKKYTSPDKTLSWTTAGKVTWQTTSDTGKKVKLTATLLPVACEDGEVELCAYFIDGGKATRLDVSYDEDEPGSPECVFTPSN